MRNLSDKAKKALFDERTDEGLVVLLTISHIDLTSPIYLCRWGTPIRSRGIDYQDLFFEVTLPQERSDQVPEVEMQIDNVDRRIVEALRRILTRPSMKIEVVLESTPDIVEVGPYFFSLGRATYNLEEVRGEVTYEDTLIEGFPNKRYIPSKFPGLF